MEDMKKYENMTVQEKWSILATVANLYYNSEMTQNEIADRMYTSRSKISRMLKEARELGIVEISIKEPWERDLNLEKEIQQTYGVKTVRVVSSRDISKEQITSRLSEVSAYYLDSVVKEKMVVGISWGNTLYHIVKYIDANNKKNIPITVVPIMGASNVKRPERDAMDLAKDLASAYGGTGTVPGVIVGAVLMGVINLGMSLMGVDQNMQKVVKGVVLLAAVIFDVVSKRGGKLISKN